MGLNGSGLEPDKSGRPKLDLWWDDAGRGSYHSGWLYSMKAWRDRFLAHQPDSAFFWHSHSWRVQACDQSKLIQLPSSAPYYNVLNSSFAGGWANHTLSWTGNTGYPSRRFSTWTESAHYQGCYLTPGSVPIHRPPVLVDRLEGLPYSKVQPGYLPPGEQNATYRGLLDQYRTTYSDATSLPCTFPALPVAKLVDELVFITELEEL